MGYVNKSAFQIVERANIVDSRESMERLHKAYKDKNAEKFFDVLSENLKMVHDAQHNYKFSADLYDQYVTKDAGIGTANRVVIPGAGFSNVIDPNAIDTRWMQAFNMADLSGAAVGDIIDFESFVVWRQQGEGEDIKMSPYGNENVTTLRDSRYTCGLPFLNRWIETGQMYNLNEGARQMRLKNLEFKANQAYALLAAAGAATTTAAGVTPELIITAINTAADALLTSLSGTLQVTADTPLLFYVHGSHRALIERAFNRVRGEDGDNSVLTYNVTPVYTYNTNFPTQITANDSGNLVLPERKIIWGTFKAIREERREHFGTDSVNIKMQEYWGNQLPNTQVQTVEWA